VDEKLDRTEAELKKISSGMSKVKSVVILVATVVVVVVVVVVVGVVVVFGMSKGLHGVWIKDERATSIITSILIFFKLS